MGDPCALTIVHAGRFDYVTLTFRFGVAQGGHSVRFRAVLTQGLAAARRVWWLGRCQLPLRMSELPPPPRVSQVLSLGLSQLEKNPQLIDLIDQAQVTERQLLRDLAVGQARFGFAGWRDALNWCRLVGVLDRVDSPVHYPPCWMGQRRATR